MKEYRAHENGTQAQTVRIEFTDPVAASVAIAGSFNDWRPGTAPMLRLQNGRWVKNLVLAPGTYEYRFVVDGAWIPDPAATESVMTLFGDCNSLLEVSAPRT